MSIWKLGRRQAACVDCQHEFADGEVLFSVLAFPEGTIERHDRCSSCWNRRSEPVEPAESTDSTEIAEVAESNLWWRSRRHVTKKAGLSVDLEGLEQIFHALAEREEERLLELRYLIALLLMRKRRLILGRAFVRAGAELLAVRRPRRKEELLVQVFEFSPERMDELRADLARLFEGDDLLGEDEASSGTAAPDGAGTRSSDEAGIGASEGEREDGSTESAQEPEASPTGS